MNRRLFPVLAAVAVVVVAACAAVGRVWPSMLPADASASLVYVALGDSTVEGIGATRPELNWVNRLNARLRSIYPAATVTNLGVAGATSEDVVAEQLAPAIDLRPQLVTLAVGPNDITGGVPVERFEHNVSVIFRRLAGESRAVVVAMLLPDLAVTPRFNGRPGEAEVGRATVRFNEVLRRKARAYGVTLVDLYDPSRREVPVRPELVAGDGYHPSDEGYARWAALVWEGLLERVPRAACSEHRRSGEAAWPKTRACS